MKLAIQGHPTRGKEVIQILESLGGKNKEGLNGSKEYWYFINSDGYIRNDYKSVLQYKGFKTYTLEEFEKEFPFKVGDKVRDCSDNEIGTILGFIDLSAFINVCNELMYVVDFEKSGHANMPVKKLKPYKEMKEERNITLTLDKAKEWYKKGGELKEIALQAFTVKELNPLPKSWEEFCEKYPIKRGECILEAKDRITVAPCNFAGNRMFKNWIPSKESAEAHLAMIQLEQLRNCWRNGWEPDWNDDQQPKYCVAYYYGEFQIRALYEVRYFLSFPTREMAKEFLECFRDLIEKAEDLI